MLSAFKARLSDCTCDNEVEEAITILRWKVEIKSLAADVLRRPTRQIYQGTFLSTSNFTASASTSATMTAHSSTESQPPLRGLVD
jgi:hypothetical protein